MLNRLYGWYGKRVVWGALIALILLVIAVIFVAQSGGSTNTDEVEKKLPSVTIKRVGDFSIDSAFSVVGVVRAVSEAQLQVEAAGRITAVNVQIGDSVSAGTVLASIENSERAQLLQAEGAYESALSSSLQSGVSLEEAQTDVRNTYRDTFSTADSAVRNTIDAFFVNPGEASSGFKLTGTGDAEEYNDIRREIEVELTKWSENISSDYRGLSEDTMLERAESTITTISNFAASLALLLNDTETTANFTDAEVAGYKVEMAQARGALDGALSAISGSRKNYEQAVISSASGATSGSSALVKSALGSLRGAQSQYEKTLVRTPIPGVVNAMYLKAGEYASNGQPAAIVANNGSLEISVALNEKDLDHVAIGDEVLINNTTIGVVTHTAPAVDPLTGKSEVKISVEENLGLKNGTTVSVNFSRDTTETDTTTVIVPLKALKMLAAGSVAFGVDQNNTLIEYPVKLGSILGDSVEIIDGLTLDSEIITDARGLRAGDVVKVSVTN